MKTCLLFHKWSQWRVVEGTTMFVGIIYPASMRGREIPTQFQIRECQRCGKMQREAL